MWRTTCKTVHHPACCSPEGPLSTACSAGGGGPKGTEGAGAVKPWGHFFLRLGEHDLVLDGALLGVDVEQGVGGQLHQPARCEVRGGRGWRRWAGQQKMWDILQKNNRA